MSKCPINEESNKNMNTREIDFLSNSATMFVLSMVMASALAVPAIIAATHASTMWRLLKKW